MEAWVRAAEGGRVFPPPPAGALLGGWGARPPPPTPFTPIPTPRPAVLARADARAKRGRIPAHHAGAAGAVQGGGLPLHRVPRRRRHPDRSGGDESAGGGGGVGRHGAHPAGALAHPDPGAGARRSAGRAGGLDERPSGMRGRGWWVRVMGKEGVSRREGAGEGTRHCVRRSFVGRSQPRPPPAGQTAHNTHTGELVGGACNAPARTTEGRRGGNSTAGAASGALQCRPR